MLSLIRESLREIFNTKKGGLLRHFKLSEFEIKLYDKGIQHGKGNHYVRYEIVIKKKQNLWRKGINNAAVLLMRILKLKTPCVPRFDPASHHAENKAVKGRIC